MPSEIHRHDIGTVFKITVRDEDENIVDVSTIVLKEFIFYKPNHEKLTKTATFVTNGSDGLIQYISVDGDLDTVGIWRIQGYLVFSDFQKFYTDVKTFKVYENL